MSDLGKRERCAQAVMVAYRGYVKARREGGLSGPLAVILVGERDDIYFHCVDATEPDVAALLARLPKDDGS